jgi:hypothetical protein
MKRNKNLRLRKVHYGHYDRKPSIPHPVIRLGGKYLEAFGFEIGDTVEVKFEIGRITINRSTQVHQISEHMKT